MADKTYWRMDFDACSNGPVVKQRINKTAHIGYVGIDDFDCKFGEHGYLDFDIEFGVSKNVRPTSYKRWKIDKRRDHIT